MKEIKKVIRKIRYMYIDIDIDICMCMCICTCVCVCVYVFWKKKEKRESNKNVLEKKSIYQNADISKHKLKRNVLYIEKCCVFILNLVILWCNTYLNIHLECCTNQQKRVNKK